MTIKDHIRFAQDLAKRALICQDVKTRHNIWALAKQQLMLAIQKKQGLKTND